MNSATTRRVLRAMAWGLGLHLLAMGACLYQLRQDTQITHYRLSLRNNAVLLLGQTPSGRYKIWHFSTWPEAMKHLDEQGLALPVLSFAEQNMANEVDTLPPDARSPVYRIRWRQGEKRGTLSAPDAESARTMARYVRFGTLQPGPMGFSLSLFPAAR